MAGDERIDAGLDHMQTVVGCVNRLTAQRPEGDLTKRPWRYSHLNWGHHPLMS